MVLFKRLASLALILGLAVSVLADFDGPAPLAWRWAQPQESPPSSRPLLADNYIYITIGSRVYCIDKNTGNQIWRFPTVEQIEGNFVYGPVICNGVIVVTTGRALYGIDPKTGHETWYYTLKDPQISVTSQPVASSNMVIFNQGSLYEDNLMAIMGADGKPAWKEPQHIYDRLKGNLTVYKDRLFLFTQNNDLMTTSATTPSQLKKVVNLGEVSADAAPVIDSDTLYINSSSYVIAVNALSASLRWQRNTEEDLVFDPAASAEGVATVSRDGYLTLMDIYGHIRSMRDEQKKTSVPMQIDLGGEPAGPPAAIGKFFGISTSDGVFNLIDPETGHIIWRYALHPMEQTISTQDMIKHHEDAQNQSTDISYSTLKEIGAPIWSGDSLLLFASDGSLLSFDKTLGVDLTGPQIQLKWPAQGAMLNGKDLQIIFSVSDDDSGVKDNTVQISVDNNPVASDYAADGLGVVVFSDAGQNHSLDDGRHTIEITATDWMGNVSKEDYSIVIDNSLQPINAPDAGKAATPFRRKKPGLGGGG